MAEFSSQQKKALRELQTRTPACASGLGNAECFLLNYITFEAQARKVWHFYQCRKNRKKESKAGIPIDELKKAMTHFEMQFDNAMLELLLDSKLKSRNEKSARNLRNGMVHQWLEDDCNEAANRYNDFLLLFNEFDAALKEVL